MNKDTLVGFINEGEDLSDSVFILRWQRQVHAYLFETMPREIADKFAEFVDPEDPFEALASQVGYLRAIADKTPMIPGASLDTASHSMMKVGTISGNKVFVVHGHDNEAKEVVSRYLEHLGLDVTVLHEQPNQGRTIIEKFELYTNVDFAIALLTPDDVGKSKAKSQSLQSRARQNVVFELGYFMALLGRDRVCALHKGGVELPSDYQGVLYIEMDNAGGWKRQVAQELVSAKMPIDINGLLK